METITNLTQSASKAIWGDSATTEEPVSGVTGDVSKGEPYDAGNIGGAFTRSGATPSSEMSYTNPTCCSEYPTLFMGM